MVIIHLEFLFALQINHVNDTQTETTDCKLWQTIRVQQSVQFVDPAKKLHMELHEMN